MISDHSGTLFMSDIENETRERYVLPEWVDSLRPVFAVLLLGIGFVLMESQSYQHELIPGYSPAIDQ